MAKMKSRNEQLKTALGVMSPRETVKEIQSIPTEDTVNRQGFAAYSLPEELRLLSMLCTLKLEPQYYRDENTQMIELRDLIERIGSKDPYFVAQCIVYARCMADGMRTINHLGAALLAPFISGQEWGKRFYSLYNHKTKQGGCIYRTDDMSEIKDVYAALNDRPLSGAMKSGFKKAIESLDAYQLAKYSKTIIDIANLVHPNPSLSKAEIDGKKVIDMLMQGETVSADTWETAQSEAGQEVAKAVREGKLSEEEAKKVLAETKNENWEALLSEGKLGILAALRNIRSMMQSPKQEVIDLLCDLVSDSKKIRSGLIMPYQIDLAYEVLNNEFSDYKLYTQVRDALLKGYESAVPNLKAALPGKTLIMLDCSGSMSAYLYDSKARRRLRSRCVDKAALIAATIAQATDADIVRFGTHAEMTLYNPFQTVFDLAKQLANDNMGCTYLDRAWELITKNQKVYDRVIILSDNECNSEQRTSSAYKEYIRRVTSPYVYVVDLAGYGTVPLKSDKVNYYAGYSYQLFDDISSSEFDPTAHIDKVRQIII